MIEMENYNRVVKNDDGTLYYLNNDLHRIDGPAKVFKKYSEYHVYGIEHSENSYKEILDMYRAVLNMIEMANPNIERKIALKIMRRLIG